MNERRIARLFGDGVFVLAAVAFTVIHAVEGEWFWFGAWLLLTAAVVAALVAPARRESHLRFSASPVSVYLTDADVNVVKVGSFHSGGKERRSLSIRATQDGVEVSIEVPDSGRLLSEVAEGSDWEQGR